MGVDNFDGCYKAEKKRITRARGGKRCPGPLLRPAPNTAALCGFTEKSPGFLWDAAYSNFAYPS